MDQQDVPSFFCCFPSFPNSRSRESFVDYSQSSRDLPAYTGPDLDTEKSLDFVAQLRQQQAVAAAPRYLAVNNLAYSPPAFEPPPYYPAPVGQEKTLLSSPLLPKAKPFRLASSLRKRKPPVYVSQSSHTVYQSVTYLTFDQHSYPHLDLEKQEDIMASNPVMPKVTTALPSGPRPVGAGGAGVGSPSSKDDILADLRRQLDDSASSMGSSIDSRGRRRRRNNKALAKNGGLQQPALLPRLADIKPVRLQLGLNLDVEVELKARLQGDVSLTLL